MHIEGAVHAGIVDLAGKRRQRGPSAMRPWTPQQPGSQRYKITHHETKKKQPA
jgi:hypothetical protein